MLLNSMRGTSLGALTVVLMLGAGSTTQASDEAAKTEGPVVQIGRADGDQSAPQFGTEQSQPEAPKYWIGLLAGAIPADHPLQAHLDLPENQGLLVANIVPDSPAAKAGIKKHDILLRANDTDLHEMHDLIEIVLAEGEKKGQITLEAFRHGNRESVFVTPEERPADAQVSVPQGGVGGFGEGGGGFELPEGLPGELLQQFGERGPFEFRNFGPGVIVGGGQGFAGIPNGVSVSVQKEDGQPTKITVKRGEETWEVTGDDAESLKQLPEDVRPFVEQMLHGGAGRHIRMRDLQGFGRPGAEDGRLRERLDRMEKRMQELMERFGQEQATPIDPPQDPNQQTK